MRLDTGGGKTVCLAALVHEHPGASCVIAHRQELVSQISLALARQGIRHNLIASEVTRRGIAASHVAEFGRAFYDPNARCAVASVDTLIRAKGIAAWAAQVTLWVTDEGHHLVLDNKWHTAIGLFTHPAVRGLLPTATPLRADGKGLGRHADGVADAMVEGPPMRWLIEQGYLTGYRIVCPPSDLKVLEDVSANGDWSSKVLRDAAKRSHIVGDVRREYLKYAKGKLGITFTTDVETAADITASYRAAGVPAETLTGKTQDGYRRQILRRFAAREILQIVAVDIISEGFDLPAIEVASFARPTQSLGLYMQQFGRTLRPLPGKDRALIIDHVGNFTRHGPPDRPRVWSLDRRDKRAKSKDDAIPLRVCLECFQPYERIEPVCPHCGAEPPPPVARSSPEQVDGDLHELDGETLARLRQGVQERDMSRDDYRAKMAATGLDAVAVMANVKRHAAHQEAQAALRQTMAHFGGLRRAEGRGDRQIQREFYLRFGVDVLTAQSLKRAEAEALNAKIQEALP